jgi:hypothetical protein
MELPFLDGNVGNGHSAVQALNLAYKPTSYNPVAEVVYGQPVWHEGGTGGVRRPRKVGSIWAGLAK